MRIALLVVILLSIGCVENDENRERSKRARAEWEALSTVEVPAETLPDDVPEDEVLGFVISSDATCELGHGPQVKIALTNQTNTDIYLVGCLDGSCFKMRYPHCYFEITGPDGKSRNLGGPECGNMNTLREKDFRKLPPGGTFNPYPRIDDDGFFQPYHFSPIFFEMPGEYRIRFVYSTKSDKLVEWSGDDRRKVANDQVLLAMFKKVPRVHVTSNEIKVTVIEADE